MRPIDADEYKRELLVGEDYLDEDTLLTAINILDCMPTIEAEPVITGVPVEKYNELQRDIDTLKKLINGEWVNTDAVQKAFNIDFSTGLKMFEFSRTAEWNPPPLNGQKITTEFRLKRERKQ